MKSIIAILLLLVIVQCQNTEVNLNTLNILEIQSKYAVDDALTLLYEFRDTVQQQLDNIDLSLQEHIKAIDQSTQANNIKKEEKQKVCNLISSEVKRIQIDYDKINHFVEWIDDRVEKDKNQMEQHNIDRCKAHLTYIDYLKNSRLMLRLIDFLRRALQKYSFVQMGAVTDILTNYMKKPVIENAEALKEMFQQLDQQDQGYHKLFEKQNSQLPDQMNENILLQIQNQDPNRFKVPTSKPYQGFNNDEKTETYKQDLLALLDLLETSIKAEMARRADNEIVLNEAVIKYTFILEKEVNELQKHRKTQVQQLDLINAELTQRKEEETKCLDQVRLIDAEFEKEKELAEGFKQDKTKYKEQLLEQKLLISELIVVYEGKIASTEEVLKKRLDGHIIDAKIQDSSYDTRQLKEEYEDVVTQFEDHITDKTTQVFEKQQ